MTATNSNVVDELKKISDKKDRKKATENLISYGIRRQLRWSVFTISSLLALISLYNEVHPFLTKEMLNSIFTFDGLIKWLFTDIGFILIFIVASFGILFCEWRSMKYYAYMYEIEKFWISEFGSNLIHKNIFAPNSILSGIMNNPKVIIVGTIIVISLMFGLPLFV